MHWRTTDCNRTLDVTENLISSSTHHCHEADLRLKLRRAARQPVGRGHLVVVLVRAPAVPLEEELQRTLGTAWLPDCLKSLSQQRESPIQLHMCSQELKIKVLLYLLSISPGFLFCGFFPYVFITLGFTLGFDGPADGS